MVSKADSDANKIKKVSIYKLNRFARVILQLKCDFAKYDKVICK